MSCHSIFSFCNVLLLTDRDNVLDAPKSFKLKMNLFSEIFLCPLGDGDRNCANLDLHKQRYIFILLDGPQGACYNPSPPPPRGGRGGPAVTVPSPGRQMNYIFLLDTLFRTFPLSLQCKVLL